jgi:hypothetical protein
MTVENMTLREMKTMRKVNRKLLANPIHRRIFHEMDGLIKKKSRKVHEIAEVKLKHDQTFRKINDFLKQFGIR